MYEVIEHRHGAFYLFDRTKNQEVLNWEGEIAFLPTKKEADQACAFLKDHPHMASPGYAKAWKAQLSE